MAAIELTLEVDDKGSAVFRKFSGNVVGKVKDMSTKSNSAIKKMEAQFKRLGGAAAGVAKKIGGITIKMAALGTAAIATIAGLAVKSFASFESALVDMAKVTDEPLEAIKQKIMDLDPALGSATEMMKGYYQTISAGVTNPKKALETLTEGAKMAKSAHLDQSTAVDALTKLMTGYQGEIKNVTEAADLLFTIEKEGVTTVAKLAGEIGGLAKLSKDLGVKQNELGGSLALITQTARSTSEAANQYEAVLMGLMKPTEGMKEALEEMGYESAQAMIKQEGLAGTLQKLKEYTGGSAEKMNELFGRVEAVKGMSALAANSFKDLNEKVGAMEQKTGAAAKAWEKYKGTLSAIWNTFKNTVGKQLIMIGEKLAPAIKNVVEKTGAWLEKNRELITQEVGAWIEKIVQFAKELKPAFDSIVQKIGDWYQKNKDIMQGKFTEWLKNAATAIVSLAENVEIALIPLIALGKVFQAAGKLIAWTAAKLAEFHDWLTKITAGSEYWKLVLKFMGALSPEKPLSEALEDVKGGLRSVADLANKSYKTVINFAGNLLEGLNTARTALNSFISTTWKATLNLGGNILSGLSSALSYLRSIVSRAWTAVVEFVGKGSSELPLSEKIDELEGDLEGFAGNIESMQPQLTMNAAGATGAIENVENEWESTASQIENNVPRLSIDTNQAIAAIAGVMDYMIAISKYKYGEFMAAGMWFEARLAAKEYEKHSKFQKAQQQYSASLPEYQLPVAPSGFDIPPVTAYQLGTEYVPRTGTYMLHRGEEVKSAPVAARERRNDNTKFGDIIINIPESAAPQRPEDWRYITREYIIPEMNKLN